MQATTTPHHPNRSKPLHRQEPDSHRRMMQAPAAAPQQRASPLSPQPQGPGRSFKNVLAETLVRGHFNLEIRYVDSMQNQAQSPTGHLQWTSTVHLVNISSGVSMLSATGQESRKASAQASAAAALMALPTFEPLLQRLHRHLPAKPLLVLSTPSTSPTGPQTPLQSATARPAVATPPGTSTSTNGQQWAPPVTASLAGGNALLVPAAPGSMPAVAAATVSGHSAAFLTPSSAAALLPGSPAALSHPPGFTTHTRAPSLGVPLTAYTSQDAAVAAPVAAGLLSAAVGSAGTGPTTSTTAGVVFDPGWNYKGQLQELVHLTKGAVQKPAYGCTAEGLPHAQKFIATVVIAPGAAPPMPAAAAAVGAPAASLPAAVGGSGGAGLWPAAGVLTATGTPQPTRMKAEQAAAAVALQTPKIMDLFKGGHMLQSLKPASAVKPRPDAQAAQQQQVPLSAPGDTGTQPSSAPVSSTALIAPAAPQQQQQQTDDTPTQRLNTLVAQAGWCLEPINPQLLGGPSHSPIYEARIVINGHLLAVGRANSKAAATHTAAERVLKCMRQPAPGMPVTDSSNSMSGVSPAEVQDASLAVFAQLAQQGVSSKILSAATVTQTALCTILLQHGSSKPAVVALGTGTGFYAGDLQELAVPAQRGMLLLDCHGEVVARRSFLRWLYAQAAMVLLLHKQLQVMQAPGMTAAAAAALQQALDALPLEVVTGPAGSSCSNSSRGAAGCMGDSSNSAHDAAAAAAGAGAGQLATHSSSAFAGLKLRLKPDVKLHMYNSKVPCGDARDFHKPALRSAGPSANSNSTSHTSNYGGGRSSSAFHFSTAKPWRQLPSLPLPAQPSQPVPPLLLPSQAALDAHWPQGCALLSPGVSKSSGRLRFKVRDGENCSPVPSAAVAAAQAAAAAAAGSAAAGGSAGAAGTAAAAAAAAEAGSWLGGLRKMCCSDKVATWNALGLQGALLGQLLVEPVYLSSLTIGGPAAEFCEGAVCRAVCCRLAPDLSGLCSTSSNGDFGVALGGDCDAFGTSAGRDSSSKASKRQHLMTDDIPAGPTAGSADAGAALGQLQLPAKMAAAAQRGLVLPAPYRLKHPRLQYAASNSSYSRWLPCAGGHRSSSCTESLNWNAADRDVLEICSSGSGTALQTIKVSPPADHPAAAGTGAGPQVADMGSGETGETAPGAAAGVMEISSARSRLSKAALFGLYQELSKSAGECAGVLAAEPRDTDMQNDQHRPHTAGTGALAGDDSTAATGAAGVQGSYAAAKARNVGYMAAKALLHQHFQQRMQQDWIKVMAVVPELEQFTA